MGASSNSMSEVAPFDLPWWNNTDAYCIGSLTKKVRKINVMNTLTKEDIIIDVASEENMNEILDRFLI